MDQVVKCDNLAQKVLYSHAVLARKSKLIRIQLKEEIDGAMPS